MRRIRRLWPLVLGLCVAFAVPVLACNVPVYRFALERWRPDPYRVVLVHEGPVDASHQKLLGPLQDQQDKSAVNVTVQDVDVTNFPDDKSDGVSKTKEKAQLPMLVVNYPAHLRIEQPIWKGAIDSDAIARLTDSPIRKELIKRLVDGQTAVWLFLESGHPEKDGPAFSLLETELKKLEQELKLPELTDSPDDTLLSNDPLRIAFSLLRVPRGDPQEQMLVEMLVHSEPDLADRSDPLVFPVFGRGRALFPLVGAGITKENILESATFLVGPCSCQVKELNPGFDLLLAADWDQLLSLEGIELTAVATQERVVPKGEVELVPIPKGSSANQTPAATPTLAPAQVASSPVEYEPMVISTDQLNSAGVMLVSFLVVAGLLMAAIMFARR